MKNLAPNNKLLKIAAPTLFTVIGVILCFMLLSQNLVWLLSCHLFIGVLGLGYIIITYHKTENLFYDTNYLYLKTKGETRKVKLTDIKRIKLMMSNQRILGFRIDTYSIEFISGIKMIETLTFWPGLGSNLYEFEKHLNYYAPKTITEHTASRFNP